MSPGRESRPAAGTAPTTTAKVDNRNSTVSQQVSWWSVHEHVEPLLNAVSRWPTVGTPEWCELPDGPVKAAALYDAARHHALRIEAAQAARAEASHDVSGAADWPAIANEIGRHREAKIPRRAAS